ncbi:hypothetical protein [Nonomuraea sp. NPDC049480]|uniref:hypothetical protein n=1 Tax=Nonomuraea sp. NPDC049480 TaxID=3364353 RepID=UPI003796022F
MAVEIPAGATAAGRTWPARYTIDGTTLKLIVDLSPQVVDGQTVTPVFPVVADPRVTSGWSIYTRWSRGESRYIANSPVYVLVSALSSAGCGSKWIRTPMQKAVCLGVVNVTAWQIHKTFQTARNNNGCTEVKFDYTGGLDGWRWYTRSPTCRN